MSKIDATTQCIEAESLNFDVPDEVLESIGGAESWVNYTYYNCTGYGYCPGY